MQILLNGEAREFPAPQTVASLLLVAGYAERRVAVEVNLEIIAKSRHAQHALAEGDRVEIIQAIGGG
jgi:sulfur carrier protein